MAYGASGNNYPAYIWSQTIKGKRLEFKTQVASDMHNSATNSSDVSDEIKKILDNTNANSFIIYHRPGMTTKNLADTLINNHKIGNLLRESNSNALERSYTGLDGTPVTQYVEKRFKGVKTVVIDSQEALDNLKKEFATAPKLFINQYYIIELPYEKDAIFDDVVFQIERAFAARTLNNHVSVLTGSKALHRNLEEVNVDPVDEEANVKADDTENIFLSSNILTKILISIPLVFLMIAALLQMFYIKTPTLFVEKSIDFGRIEK